MSKPLSEEDKQEYAFFFMSMRKSVGYTLGQMARRLHIKSETLRSWERGKNIPQDHLYEIVYEVREIVKDYHKNKRLVG